MSQLSVKLSDKADALIAQLQKEIFNRRRKKVTAAGVVETLVESGARSQSDKRFATSWKNLIKDIEKAAKLANAHGSKPASLSDAEWAMVLSHRQRTAEAKPAKTAKPVTRKRTGKAASGAGAASTSASAAQTKAVSSSTKTVKKAAASTTASTTRKPRPAKRARKATTGSTATTSVAKRMAKAAGRLSSGSLSKSGISSPARS